MQRYYFFIIFAAAAVLGVCGGCAGYKIGNQTLYNTGIRTVYVPMFESDSYRRNMAERLTEAVCKRIEERTPYKVVGRPSADSVLSGKLIVDTQSVRSRNLYNDVRQKAVAQAVEVVWIDRRGNEIRRSEPIPWGITSAGITTEWTMIPETGDSTVLAQQQVIDRMAEQIVNMMENPW